MPDISLKKLPPHSVESERLVLGSILLDTRAFFTVRCILEDTDFYVKAHMFIFAACAQLSGGVIDLVTLSGYLEQKELLEKVGGEAYLMALLESVPTAAHAKHHAQIVKEKATLRQMAALGHSLYCSAYEDRQKTSELIEETERRFYELALHGKGYDVSSDVIGPEGIAKYALESIEQNKIKQRTEITVGMPRFDDVTNGLKDVTILSASTGIGKTGLAINWAANIGITQQIPSLYINYEMDKAELIYRFLGVRSGAKINEEIKTGIYDGDNLSRVVDEIGEISNSKLFITNNTPKDINTTISIIYQYKIQHGIKVVFVDYLGEVTPTGHELKEKEYITYGLWVGALKGICTKLGIKLIVVAQLNREGEDTPRRDKVAGSWKLVQKADLFCILYLFQGKKHILKIDKQRHGIFPISFELSYNRYTQRIKEVGLWNTANND